MTQLHNAEISRSADGLAGPLRRSVNAAQDVKGSIHDDATAQRLGLRGGTVAGSVHLDLFPPLLLEAFGNRWFERGSLSMNFRNATVDREAVRAHIGLPPAGAADAQVRAWIERDDGMPVAEGSAAVGTPGEPTALRSLDLQRFAAGELRILNGLEAGEAIPADDMTITPERQLMLLEKDLVTEPLAWYRDSSPWGPPVVLPQMAVHHLYGVAARHLGRTVTGNGGGVGLFGAIELAKLDGPLLQGATYSVSGQILALGQSPRTEYAWFEVTAARDGRDVAGMMMQLRWMKASSPAYS